MMIASIRLREIADLLERQQPLTAIEASDLRAIAQEVAKKLGYDGVNDMDLLLDAWTLRSKKEGNHADTGGN